MLRILSEENMTEFDWFRDTDPRALEVFLDLQREMPVADKLQATFGMMEMLWNLAESGVRSMYPQAGEREVFLRTAARRLDRDTMIRVYGWDPKAHG
jgi:hypothetical protein